MLLVYLCLCTLISSLARIGTAQGIIIFVTAATVGSYSVFFGKIIPVKWLFWQEGSLLEEYSWDPEENPYIKIPEVFILFTKHIVLYLCLSANVT